MMNDIICTLEKNGFCARYCPGACGGHHAVICADTKEHIFASDFLRDAGFNVLELEMDTQRGRISVDRVQQAMCWLKAQYDIDRIAVTGEAIGGQYALLAASLIPGISCVIPVSPFDYICEAALYTRHGLDLPYTRLQRSALRDIHEYNEMSRIPYQNMKSDILLLGVKNDDFWPSDEAVSRIADRLQKAEYPYCVETRILDRHTFAEEKRGRIIAFLNTRLGT